MKRLILLLFIPIVLGCNDDDEKIIITSQKSYLDCHMCPGYIIIKKGISIDTLKRGSWGIPPNFKKFNHNERDFILFKTGYFMGGIWESSISILSLNNDDFLNIVFDTLVIDRNINEFKIKRKEIEFILPDSLLIHSYNEIYNKFEGSSKKKDNKKEVIILNY